MKRGHHTERSFEAYRTVFLQCGLLYGRHFGSKSAYSATNIGCIYIPNACVYTSQRHCIWRGDLDLSTTQDVEGLIRAARFLNRKLFVLREQTDERIPPCLKAWFAACTVVSIWRGRVAAGGDSRCLRGQFREDYERETALRVKWDGIGNGRIEATRAAAADRAKGALAKCETVEVSSHPEAMKAAKKRRSAKTKVGEKCPQSLSVTWRGRNLGTADSIMYYRGRLYIDAIRGAVYLADLPDTPLLDDVLRSDDYEVEIRVLRRIPEGR